VLNVWGYLDEYEVERDDLLDAVDRVFRSGQLILGGSVTRFEEEFAAFCGVRHGVSCDNGTNALVLALEAVGVGRGDEVVTVSNTAAPTVVAIDTVGARARFVDVDHATGLMAVDQIEAVLTDRTTCLLPVHLYGQCVDMAAVRAVADRHGLKVIEDCAQAHGARHHDRVAGSMGDAAAFSFYPTKVLGAYGDGGIVLTDDDEVEANLRRLRYYGMTDRYYVERTPAHNSRLDTVQAEILRRKLCRLPAYIERRQELARRYGELLDGPGLGLVLPTTAPGNEHVHYLYVVRHPRRDAIIEAMRAHGVNCNVSYRWPCHTMTGFADLGYGPDDLPVTTTLATEIFSLPMFPSLTDEDQAHVAESLAEVARSLDRAAPVA